MCMSMAVRASMLAGIKLINVYVMSQLSLLSPKTAWYPHTHGSSTLTSIIINGSTCDKKASKFPKVMKFVNGLHYYSCYISKHMAQAIN